MMTAIDIEVTARKANAMTEWAEILARGAHDALGRMSATLTQAEVGVARMREMVARRRRAKASE